MIVAVAVLLMLEMPCGGKNGVLRIWHVHNIVDVGLAEVAMWFPIFSHVG